ncbi:MAG: hypothetical protein HN509_03900, partial [Halobacteriovoraceae bacterium]|nr:hypothetical protein [Halobacteriovoraceae bacterium]
MKYLILLFSFLLLVEEAKARRGANFSIPRELTGRAERILSFKCKNGKEVTYKDYRPGKIGNDSHVSYSVPRYYPQIDAAL